MPFTLSLQLSSHYSQPTLRHCLGCSQVPGLSGNSVQELSRQHNTLTSTDSLSGPDHRRMLNKFHGYCLQSGDSQPREDTAKTVKVKDSTHLPLVASRSQCLLIHAHASSSLLRLTEAFLSAHPPQAHRCLWPLCSLLPNFL